LIGVIIIPDKLASVNGRFAFSVDGEALHSCASPLRRVTRPEGKRMPAVQPRLPLALPMQARARSVRRPFRPPQDAGSYKLPHDVRDRLTAALAPYRNRNSAFVLAVFLGRFWSTPSRIGDAFPIDRRELANRPDLGLTEDRVRGAIRVLEEVGFLDRAPASGSRYKATEAGLRRKPILFVFGSDYAHAFIRANSRAGAARGGHSGERRSIPAETAQRRSTALPVAQPLKSPKSKSEAESSMLMGEARKESGISPTTFEPNLKLESALERLLQGIRHSRSV
jgi:hypothetical protein